MNACQPHMRPAYALRTCETEMHGRTDVTDLRRSMVTSRREISPFVTRAKKAQMSSRAEFTQNGTER